MKKNTSKIKNKNIKTFIYIILLLVLLVTNIFTFYKYYQEKHKEIPNPSNIVEKVEESKEEKTYNKDKKYYKDIKFDEFKSLYKGKDISIIAVVDNSSYTYEKFIELINKSAYYKKLNINLIEISKLSKKDMISFYEIDERFVDLESDFVIVVKEGKILSLTEIESTDLNTLIATFE